jgi:hypothetical protein
MNAKQTIPVSLSRKIYELKDRLVKKALNQSSDHSLDLEIQIVANDALVTASLHPLPLLVLPVVFEDKVETLVKVHQENHHRIAA